MRFPCYLQVGPWLVPPHPVFEALAYAVGFRVYSRLRAGAGDFLPFTARMWVLAAAIAGAALGSKALYWLEDPVATCQHWRDPFYLLAGKSIVGGLLGGLIAVEWSKRRLGITRSTGDLFALPLVVGMAIGRIGCFLTGLSDRTYGLATGLPWGVDFGDGIPRHPTQLYEILWLGLLGGWLRWRGGQPHREGDLFKGFMIGYMAFRLLAEGIKPGLALGGLTAIQWACVAALIYYSRDIPRLLRPAQEIAHG